MGYNKKSDIGELQAYKGGMDEKISFDAQRKEDASFDVFNVNNVGFNAVRFDDFEKSTINEASKVNITKTNSISPGGAASIEEKLLDTNTFEGTGVKKTSSDTMHTFIDRAALNLLTESYSVNDGIPDAVSVFFDTIPYYYKFLDNGFYFNMTPISVEAVAAENFYGNADFFDLCQRLVSNMMTTSVYADIKEITQIICRADDSGDLDGTWFFLSDEIGTVAFWIDVDNDGTTIPAGAAAMDRAVEITTISTNDSIGAVGTAVYLTIIADAKFQANNNDYAGTIKVESTTFGDKPNGADGDTGFTLSEDTRGSEADLWLEIYSKDNTLLSRGLVESNSLSIGSTHDIYKTTSHLARYGNSGLLYNPVLNSTCKLKPVSPQATSLDMGRGDWSHIQRLSGRQFFVAKPATTTNESLKHQYASSDFEEEYITVYSNDGISIAIHEVVPAGTAGLIRLTHDGVDYFCKVVSGILEELTHIKDVTNVADYKSFIFESSSDYFYLVFRKASTFSGGYLIHNASTWHLTTVKSDHTVSIPSQTESVTYDLETCSRIYDVISSSEHICSSRILIGTRDLLVLSDTFDLTHTYGVLDMRLVAGGWFDKAYTLTSAKGISLSLPNTITIPNYFNRYHHTYPVGMVKAIDDSSSIDVPTANLWTNLLSSNTYPLDAYIETDLDTDFDNSTTVFFEQLSVSTDGGYHSLPKATEEVMGYDPMEAFLLWSKDFFKVGKTSFCRSGNKLCIASPIAILMPNPNQIILEGYNKYYGIGNYIVASGTTGIDIYSYTDDQGIIMIATIMGAIDCEPAMYNKSMYVVSYNNTHYMIHKLDDQGVVLVYDVDIDRITNSYDGDSTSVFLKDSGRLVLMWMRPGLSLETFHISNGIDRQTLADVVAWP